MDWCRLAVLGVVCLAGYSAAFGFFPAISFGVRPQTMPTFSPVTSTLPSFAHNPPEFNAQMELNFDVHSVMDFVNRTSRPQIPPPGHLLPNAIELANAAGYPCEAHKVVTSDGYILTMHRLTRTPWKRSYPILIMHGLLGASDAWILNGRGTSLPYLLVDNGYEVWLGNFRTNYYSKAHIKYSPKSRKFWDYSFHEMGLYDIPAMIDKALEVSGHNDLIYMGHSMGTSAFLAMASQLPKVSRRVRASMLLAPVAFQPSVYQVNPFLRTSISQSNIIYKALYGLGLNELLPRNYYLVKTVQDSCGLSSPLQKLCLDIVFAIYGRYPQNVDMEYAGYQYSTLVSGTSIKNVHHLGQLFLRGRFSLYDYGSHQNKIKYGTSTPPDYKLRSIQVPIYLYHSDNDQLVHLPGVARLNRELPNSKMIRIPDTKFSHIDFLFGRNAPEVLYNDVLIRVKELTISNELGLLK